MRDMFRLVENTLLLILVSLSISMHIVSPINTQNNAVIYSNGKYVLTIIYRDRVEYIDQAEEYGSYKQYLLSYRVKYKPFDNRFRNVYVFKESFNGTKVNEKTLFSYELLFNSSADFIKHYTTFVVDKRVDFINITSLFIDINTTSIKYVLSLNATILSTYLLSSGFSYRVNYSEINGYYLIRLEISNLVLNHSSLDQDTVYNLLRIPRDIGLNILLDNRVKYVTANSWLEGENLLLERRIFGLDLTSSIVENKYTLSVQLPGNYSRDLIIGFSNRVSIDAIDWRIIARNNTIEANIAIEGSGYGSSALERVESCIRNIYELSIVYGCVKTSLSGFRILFRNNTTVYDSINICRDTDIDEITISLSNGEEPTYKAAWNIHVLIILIAVITLLLITLIYLIRRVR